MLPRSLGRYLLVLALLSLLALASVFAFAACGGGGEEGTTPTEGQTPAAGETPTEIDISAVPELQDGILSVGSDISYAPFEFYQEGTDVPDGLDIDMGTAIADALGVDVDFINTGWDGIIPALQTEDFDVLMSAMTITPERSQEIDFVPYITVGTGVVVPTGNPNNIHELADLCGLTVAVQVGTIQEQMLNDQNDQCDQQINIVTFDTNPLAVEDLRTGGADANFSDFPVAAEDAANSGGTLEVVEPQIDAQPYGVGIRKTSTELNDVITKAVQAIRDNGTYDEVLAKWDLQAVALP
jgi:polar amino acid transport system substrate-binding protein